MSGEKQIDLGGRLATLRPNIQAIIERYKLKDPKGPVTRTRKELEQTVGSARQDLSYLLSELEWAWQVLQAVANHEAQQKGQRVALVSEADARRELALRAAIVRRPPGAQ